MNAQRNSRIELFRILAAFFVLITHFNGVFLGGVIKTYNPLDDSVSQIGQIVITALTCICVNMFLLITGYFGATFKLKKVLRLWLFLVVINFSTYLLQLSLEMTDFSVVDLLKNFGAFSKSGYFVQGFVLLLFFSPVFNSFITNNERPIVLRWTVTLLLIEFWTGCIMRKWDFYDVKFGYSFFHFVVMYFVGRCVMLYREYIPRWRGYVWLILYLICTAVLILMFVKHVAFTWDYSNPIIILSSLVVFMPFILGRPFHSRIVNWVSTSTFSVYILQVTPPFSLFLSKIDSYLFATYSYSYFLFLIFLVIISVFIVFILLDKLVALIVDPITNLIITVSNRWNHK